MQVQVNTDSSVEGRDELARRVEAEIRNAVGRFTDHVTRIEVHLADENADRGGTDKRCLIEARLSGRRPEAVSHRAATLDQAFSGAAQKLRRSLETTLGRLADHKGGPSIRTDGAT